MFAGKERKKFEKGVAIMDASMILYKQASGRHHKKGEVKMKIEAIKEALQQLESIGYKEVVE